MGEAADTSLEPGEITVWLTQLAEVTGPTGTSGIPASSFFPGGGGMGIRPAEFYLSESCFACRLRIARPLICFSRR